MAQAVFADPRTVQKFLWELSETLGAVHLASEHGDANKVKAKGDAYLDTAKQVFGGQ